MEDVSVVYAMDTANTPIDKKLITRLDLSDFPPGWQKIN